MKTIVATTLAAAAAIACALPAQASTWNTLDGAAPIVIAHRGASGYRPEHTLASYALAIQMGANYIEPDLVMTRDGHLIARHEPVLDGTTNVASVFDASRKTTRMLDGVSTTAYFADTFTLAEIKTLSAVQTRGRTVDYGSHITRYDSDRSIPTLDEVIALAKAQSTATGRTIGIYPELKHSTYTSQQAQALGFSATYFEDKLVSTLHAAYGNSANAPVFIQSFEVNNLQYLNTRTDIKLVQLVDADDVRADGSMSLVAPYDRPYDQAARGRTVTFADLVSDVGLRMVATYADGIGPWKPYLVKTVDDGIDRTGDGVVNINDRLVVGSTGVIEAAHAAGLLVHTWTFRNDASGYGFADPQAEMQYYYSLGVDGLFTDFTDTGVAALAAAAVPEPGTYALMLGGLLAVGAAARRRRGG
ncbi:glycerophosphodiester phosphodiesterase family protein [Aquabacterium sp. OR-4]|uniref:glycerophosphodiester phosphodiesterase family protein n=1 Tax=Aquabacterium sp. OR-4 TaxID=2978127 RepID=UPI0021B339B4|nr:glycerophosphodiester phosphodiesterase family protein [Aquabacterium sp. OR-4]MDT7833891.1 glycerophosphodiester phosphodiesterase family protein [Aquabacterium sp. OR-4]